jgi:TRAP-type C4-dicarboxylate transport system substrate-binding protein
MTSHDQARKPSARRIARREMLVGLGAASALATLPVRAARAAAQYTLRLASWGAPTAPQVMNFVGPFQKAVEAGSHGRIAVQSFPAGSLVKEQAVPAAIQSRVVDISLTTMGSWASVVPAAGVLNTVFFSPLAADFEKAIGPDTPLFKTLDQAMASHGVRLLAVLYNGPVVCVSRAPMDSPAAFRGKTVRVFDRLTAQIVQTLGGAPSTIEVADVYPALERGTVQGAIGGLEGAIGLKEYEVSKYLLATNGVFGLLITGYVMNRAALDALPADLQKVVLDAGHRVGVETSKAMVAAYARELSAMHQHGMTVTVLEPGKPQYQAFTAALAPLKKTQEAQFPPDLVKQVLDAQR